MISLTFLITYTIQFTQIVFTAIALGDPQLVSLISILTIIVSVITGVWEVIKFLLGIGDKLLVCCLKDRDQEEFMMPSLFAKYKEIHSEIAPFVLFKPFQ